MKAGQVRSHIPIPVNARKWVAWGLVFVGLVWLYDSYDGSGKDLPFPFGAITPW